MKLKNIVNGIHFLHENSSQMNENPTEDETNKPIQTRVVVSMQVFWYFGKDEKRIGNK